MLDHVTLNVRDLKKSKDFFLAALKPLGYTIFMENEEWVGFVTQGEPDFWLKQSENSTSALHFAFRANTRKIVDEFYEAALAAGGEDNGAPGIREIYHSHYYGAFIIGPEGHNIEAVCHHSEQ